MPAPPPGCAVSRMNASAAAGLRRINASAAAAGA